MYLRKRIILMKDNFSALQFGTLHGLVFSCLLCFTVVECGNSLRSAGTRDASTDIVQGLQMMT